jgi:putative acetyltransferase
VEIRQDDPTAPYVAYLLAHHLEELRSVMGEHAQALDASGLSGCERHVLDGLAG